MMLTLLLAFCCNPANSSFHLSSLSFTNRKLLYISNMDNKQQQAADTAFDGSWAKNAETPKQSTKDEGKKLPAKKPYSSLVKNNGRQIVSLLWAVIDAPIENMDDLRGSSKRKTSST